VEASAGGNRITARKLVDARREIGCYLDPTLFTDPVYDILFGLMAAEDEHTAVVTSDCARFANVAATTALRYVALLEQRGLLSRGCGPNDSHGASLMLTDECRAALHAYLDQVTQTLASG
jgi:DNA-binding MarR family transcriptional regulator